MQSVRNAVPASSSSSNSLFKCVLRTTEIINPFVAAELSQANQNCSLYSSLNEENICVLTSKPPFWTLTEPAVSRQLNWFLRMTTPRDAEVESSEKSIDLRCQAPCSVLEHPTQHVISFPFYTLVVLLQITFSFSNKHPLKIKS